MNKHISFCADDYGLSPHINEGILTLFEHNRLTATSCITTQADWQHCAKALLPWKSTYKIGLHFTLTEKSARGLKTPHYTLPSLILKTQMRKVNKQRISDALNEQIDRFVDALGKLPDFIDGHQHIHQFPVIRDVFVDLIQNRYTQQKPYVRVTNPEDRRLSQSALKKIILGLLGGYQFKKLINKHHIPHNASFEGIYQFVPSNMQYDKLFTEFLERSQHNGLIMCHPAAHTMDNDSISAYRKLEFDFLMSDAFTHTLNKMHVSLET